MIYGIALFITGLVLFTIGGFITMVRNPKLLNDQTRALLDPVRSDIPKDARTAFDTAMMCDPKAKWFSRVGFALCLTGMAVIYFSSERSGNSVTTVKVNVTNQPK